MTPAGVGGATDGRPGANGGSPAGGRGADRVVVTGMGAVTPYGVGVARFVEGLLAGRPTAAPVTRFDASAHPARIGCEVPGFGPKAYLPRRTLSQLDPFSQYALVAAEEALGQAGLLAGGYADPGGPAHPADPADGSPTGLPPVSLPLADGVDPTRVGVLVASSAGGISEITTQHARLLADGPRRVRPFMTVAHPSNMASGQVAIRHGLQGMSFSVSSACASAADAIGVALDLVRAGRLDVVVAGGAEAAINPLVFAAFGAAGALSRRNADPERASRPFDVDRDGFVPGEGAGVLVLERESHARARGATVLAVLAGYGASNDAHHPTQPAPGGEGGARAIRIALADAGADVGDVGHINAHGTSTPANDLSEAAAIRAVFGTHTDDIAVTSTKSATGHLLGAAGAVEAIATVVALADGVVAPTLNLDKLDPEIDIDVVSGGPRRVAADVACSNSFGFGGHNAVLVLRRP